MTLIVEKCQSRKKMLLSVSRTELQRGLAMQYSAPTVLHFFQKKTPSLRVWEQRRCLETDAVMEVTAEARYTLASFLGEIAVHGGGAYAQSHTRKCINILARITDLSA